MLPRSPEKIQLLAARFAARKPLFDAEDALPSDEYQPPAPTVENEPWKLWEPWEDRQLLRMKAAGRTWNEIGRELDRTRAAVRSRHRHLQTLSN